MPLPVGSGPIRPCAEGSIPEVTNLSILPSALATPSAPYRAPTSRRAQSTTVCSTVSGECSATIVRPASFNACSFSWRSLS